MQCLASDGVPSYLGNVGRHLKARWVLGPCSDMLVAYNALLHFVGEMAQLEEALAVFKSMQQAGEGWMDGGQGSWALTASMWCLHNVAGTGCQRGAS